MSAGEHTGLGACCQARIRVRRKDASGDGTAGGLKKSRRLNSAHPVSLAIVPTMIGVRRPRTLGNLSHSHVSSNLLARKHSLRVRVDHLANGGSLPQCAADIFLSSSIGSRSFVGGCCFLGVGE